MEVDTHTKVKIATGLRKGKKAVSGLFTGCKGENTDGGVTSAPDLVINTLGFAGFCIAIAAFPLAAGGVVVNIVGSFLVAFCPYVIYQKKVLQDLGSFRSLLNSLRGKINGFMLENDQLQANIQRLSSSVDDLESIEADFSKLTGSNNVDRLVEVIKETKHVNTQIRVSSRSVLVIA
jgi:competence protein ComGC